MVETALLVVQGALVAVLLAIAARFLLTSKRRFGSAHAWARKYSRAVHVRVPYEEAHALVHRGLAEVLETMTVERDRRGEFGAWAGLDRRPGDALGAGGGGVRNRLQFSVERAGEESTRITITSVGATGMLVTRMHPATVAGRRDQVDRLAGWLEQR